MESNDRERDDEDDDSESSSDSDEYQDIPDALSSLNKEKNDNPENSDEESDINSDEESDRPDYDQQSDMNESDDDDSDDDDEGKKKKEKKKEQMEEEDVDDVIEEGRLFIRNLPYSCTEEEIKAFMKQHGEITDVFIPLNAKRESKGFAFVTFMFPEQAILAMEVGLMKK